jgi:hypothetical protein
MCSPGLRADAPRALARSAAALALGTGMGGSTAYVAWWDDAAGRGRVVRAAWRGAAGSGRGRALPALRHLRRPRRRARLTRARAAQVSYYCEEGNAAAAGVLPTGEALSDVSVNVTSAGVLSFRFTRALAAAPGRAPPRPLGPHALAAFPLAQLDGVAPLEVTAALFPSWSVAHPGTDTPAPGDAHFVHAGAAWTRTPQYLALDWATGALTPDSQLQLDAAWSSAPAACTIGLSGPPPGSAAPTLPLPPAPGAPGAPGAPDAPGVPAAPCAPPAPRAPSGVPIHTSSEHAGMDMDMSGGDSSGSMAMGGMGGMAMMHSAFFTASTGWGSVLFPAAAVTTRAAFAGVLLLSALFAACTTLLAAAARPLERRGADAAANPAWVAAGFLSTAARTGSHYVSMLLVMTFNVWVILAVLGGHAAGYLLLATAFRNGVLPSVLLGPHAQGGAGAPGGLGEDGAEELAGGAALLSPVPGAPLIGKTAIISSCGATGGASCDCA